MSRKLISLCLLLAISGCSDATKKGPVTGTGESSSSSAAIATRETPAVKQEATEPPALKPMESEPPAEVSQEVKTNETPQPKVDPEKGLTRDEAFAQAQKLFQSNDLEGVVQVLERALPQDPDDINLLLSLAQLTTRIASSDRTNPDFEKYLKAGKYVHQALRAHPEIAGNPQVRNLASGVLYNEACALSVGNQTEQAMKSLEEAVAFGYKGLTEMDQDKDLAAVRALPAYAEFKSKAEEMLREQAELARIQIEKEVDELLADNKSFDFNFELTDTEAKPIAKADFAGKVLIVDVWGTWCPPCRAEIPHFVKLQKTYNEEGLVIVGLNQENAADDEAAAKLVQDFREKNEMNYRCALIGDDTLQQIPEFSGFPTTMFIDRTGKVRAKVVGLHDYEYLETIVRKLLAEKIDGAEAGSNSDK
ncbi:MAG: TlpA disulfide reductase family protein [Schlesneria sp.]